MKTHRSYSCGIFSSGGLLCTHTAIRAGFSPLWGTEIEPKMQQMWSDLTKTRCLGDTFAVDFRRERRVIYLKSGQPCPDWSSSHAGRAPPGAAGDTGWQYVQQAEKIMQVEPKCFLLEMVANCLLIDDAAGVMQLMGSLREQYYLHCDTIRVAQHGDCSNRERFFIVGFHRSMGTYGQQFMFPEGEFDDSRYITARDVAVDDSDVPDKFWLTDRPGLIGYEDPEPLRIHKVGQVAPGMGPSRRPNAVQSHDGIYNTQTTYNGGGRRVPLSWRAGDPIDDTRKTIPTEAVRIASLPADYQDFVAKYDESDEFLFKCVNMGIPCRTGMAIDCAIHDVLVAAGIGFDIDDGHMPNDDAVFDVAYEASVDSHKQSWVGLMKHIRSIVLDTGANGTFMYTDIEPYLDEAVESNARINTAGGNIINGSKSGKLKTHVLNLAGYDSIPMTTDFEMEPTTVPQLSKELLSADDYFRYGKFNVLLRQPDYEGGVSELYRAASPGIPEARIPLIYDYRGKGGWHLYFVPSKAADRQDIMALARHIEDEVQNKGIEVAQRVLDSLMSGAEAAQMATELEAHPAVASVVHRNIEGHEDEVVTDQAVPEGTYSTIIAQHPGEVETKGVKAGLKSVRKKLKIRDFHNIYSHMGSDPDCKICKMVKGNMRRIRKKIDPYRETRPGHTWGLDFCTFSDRSMDGCKYLGVLRDYATGVFKLIPVARRTTAAIAGEIEDWVKSTRGDPVNKGRLYELITAIKTDNEGAWRIDTADWQDMLKDIHVNMVYCEPDRHAEENGYAESAVQTVEIVIKQILMANNLPPSYWQAAAADAEWLLNRFPVASDDVAIPMDGDRSRPLEMITRGYYSRRQIDRELGYYCAVGTPCLVHNAKVKGSSLEPKVRWGIAMGMYREQVWFMCPFSKSRFKSKSYSAYRLKEGMNWSQFLGLGPIANTKKAMALPEDSEPPMGTLIKLPKCSELESMRPPQATVATGGSVRLEDSEGRQLLSDLDDGTVDYQQCDGLLEEPITVMTNGKHDVTHSDDTALSISYGDTRDANTKSSER